MIVSFDFSKQSFKTNSTIYKLILTSLSEFLSCTLKKKWKCQINNLKSSVSDKSVSDKLVSDKSVSDKSVSDKSVSDKSLF